MHIIAYTTFLYIISAGASGQNNSSIKETTKVTIKINRDHDCSYHPGERIQDNTERQICCILESERFEDWWSEGDFYLTTFLLKMKSWKCTKQMDYQCRTRPYAFNKFTSIVYDKFCEEEKYGNACYEKVYFAVYGKSPDNHNNTTMSKQTTIVNDDDILSDNDTTESETENGSTSEIYIDSSVNLVKRSVDNFSSTEMLRNLMKDVSSANFTTEQLLQECVAVALFDSDASGFGSYHETITPFVPFCDIIWCGFDSKHINDSHVSPWTCMPQSCKAGVVIQMLVAAILAVMIVIANSLVLAVFATSKKLRNSQVVYKTSLAIADLLVGLIVLPTFIVTLYNWTNTRHLPGSKFYPRIENNITSTSKDERLPGGAFYTKHSIEYLDGVGFFTALSLLVSIYTLTMAGFDRLWAIARPMTYSRSNNQKAAVVTVVVVWIIAIVFSCLPYLSAELEYNTIASVIVGQTGQKAVILYIILFLLPIVVCWCTAIAVFLTTRCHSRERAKMISSSRSASKKLVAKMDMRLARTLSLMIGVFTFCLMPTAIVLLVSLGTSEIYYNNPYTFSQFAAKAMISSEYVSALILMTNSLWNFFIYSARNHDFRTATRIMYYKLLKTMGMKIKEDSWKAHSGLPSISHSHAKENCDHRKCSLPPTHDSVLGGFNSSNQNSPQTKRSNMAVIGKSHEKTENGFNYSKV